MIEKLIEVVNSIILLIGYPGIMFLMFLESTMFPIPSEIVMPFAGYLVAEGKLSFALVVFLSGIGSILGSLFSYYIGYYGGRPLVNKVGHYFLLDGKKLDWAENWFKKQGDITIFISRFIPVIRHVISLPAGIGKMNLSKFCIYTFVGATIWNGILTYLGYYLGKNYLLVHEYSQILDYIVIVLIILGLIYYIWYFYSVVKRKK